MARQLRFDFPGALHHVTSRGNEQRDIFRDDLDRSMFITLLGRTVLRFGWSLTAWVLMTNHVHLVVHTPEANLSRGMQWLNGTYAKWFNHRHGRCGHLSQGRFKSRLIEQERYFRNVLRYVVLNPVRAGMVERAEEWAWSSYRSTAGLEPRAEWLNTPAVYALFDSEPSIAQALYQAFVAAGGDERLWDELVHGIFLGRPGWARQMRKVAESRPRSIEHPKRQRAVGRPGMREIIRAVARAAGAGEEAIRLGRGGSLRRLAAWIGWTEGLVPLHTIASSLLLHSEGHVCGMLRRCERELGENPLMVEWLDRALADLRE